MTRGRQTRRRRGLGAWLLFLMWRGWCRLPLWFRIPLVTLSAYFGAGWLYFGELWQSILILAGIGLLVYAGWVGRRIHRASQVGAGRPPWRQLLTAPIVEHRRIGRIRRQWVKLCLEVGWYYGDHDRPLGLRKLAATPTGDVVAYVAPGAVALDLEKVEKGAPRIAYTVGAREVVTRRAGPGRLRLHFYYSDPLHRVLQLRDLPWAPTAGDICVGVQQDGTPATLNGRQPVLIGGMTDMGKSNTAWVSIADHLRQGIHIELMVSDLKGGTEMTALGKNVGKQMGHLRVSQYTTDLKGTEELLDNALKVMRVRQAWMSKNNLRQHVVSAKYPKILLLLDEFLAMTAICKKGAGGPLGLLLSQGRAAGIQVYGLAQLGHASVLDVVRNLFPQRRCFAMRSPAVTDTILGQGAEAAGALCSQLDENRDKGIMFGTSDSSRTVQKARVAIVTDEEVALIATGRLPAGMSRERPRSKDATAVYRFYGVPDARGGRRLIYLGITNDPGRRMGEHRNRSAWWPLVDESATPKPVWFQSEAGARVEEQRAIEAELPLYNDKHNRRNPFRVPRARPALPALTARPEPYAEQIPAEAAVGGEVVDVEPSDMIDQEVTR